ncbi:Meiosis-specific protein hop1 [Cyphellophora attinorum]|uniref:Meiosis-specific protein hop1 n=1 Tax=Cyphellophora attinorum TaxID=1664694 RepID=A0A0N0NMV0_9EURO|nr:Meiosis-specific protein hop1 [Phialophora attinorum]KPI40881.1 Meiosis-specific protein hop1 [Phialophora attinorum]
MTSQSMDIAVLSKDQSLALVKIFLNASLACICHTRELINWESACFRKRYVDHISLKGDSVYESFCSSDPPSPGSSQEIRVLARGHDHRANALLNMIERGVFRAIEEAYLDVLQVFITIPAGKSQSIQETYTYSFTYFENAVASVEWKEQQQFLSLADAQRSFKTAIRSLLRSIQDLPSLQDQCSLGMSMAYNDSCPRKYEPEGFMDASDDRILAEDWAKLWEEPTDGTSAFEAAHHSVTIAARNPTSSRQTASQVKDTAISRQLQQLQKTSSGRHPGLVSTLPLPATPYKQNQEVIRDALVTPDQLIETRSTRSSTRQIHTSPEEQQRPSEGINSAAYVPAAQPAANPLRGLTIQSANRRKRNIIPEKMAKVIVQAHCLDFEAEDGLTFFDSVQLDRGILYRIDRSTTVCCDCGDQQQRGLMVYCHLCDSSQHAVCYGLSSLRPRSRPDQHLCYSCLLLPEDPDKVQGMSVNVHIRLALTYIADLQYNTFIAKDPGFCDAVFGNVEDIDFLRQRLIERLVRENIVAGDVSDKLVILAHDEEGLNRLRNEYLDPLANVAHLYRLTTSKNENKTLEGELRAYSGGREYKFGVGVEDKVLYNSLGEPVVCWGYFAEADGNNNNKTIVQQSKRKAGGTNGGHEPSPRRRKISISRAFIALDRSTPLHED